MAEMTPADELRTAAKVVRHTASRVPQGLDDDGLDWAGRPWQTEACQDGCACIVYQGEYKPHPEPQVPPIQYVADAETEEHAAWIALMGPDKAEFIADVLDDQAALYEVWLTRENHDVAERIVWRLLALARSINGELDAG